MRIWMGHDGCCGDGLFKVKKSLGCRPVPRETVDSLLDQGCKRVSH